jgi:hypothetical protein
MAAGLSKLKWWWRNNSASQKISGNECTVFPNPANEILTIEITPGTANNKIENYFYLYDQLGRIIDKEKLINSLTKISLMNFVEGVYYYQITDDKKNIIQSDKLVIIR